MAFGFGSFGSGMLGALGMPQTGGVTGQPSVDPGQLQTSSDQGQNLPLPGFAQQDDSHMYTMPDGSKVPYIPFMNPYGQPQGGPQFQPAPGVENPGGQMMPPQAGGAFGGGASMGGPRTNFGDERDQQPYEQDFYGDRMHTMNVKPGESEFNRYYRDYWAPDRASVLAKLRGGGQKQGSFLQQPGSFANLVRMMSNSSR